MHKILLVSKITALLVYIIGAICLWQTAQHLYNIPYASAIFPIYLACGIVVWSLLRYPYGKETIENGLRSIGFVNYFGQPPELVRKYHLPDNPHICVLEFKNTGIPLSTWEAKQQAIEAGINKNILKMKYHKGKRRVQVFTVHPSSNLPTKLQWNEKFLSSEEFTLVLGEGLFGRVEINLDQIPHVLLGGSSGCGKSILLKLMLMQSLRKSARVFISDFKGGVDFPPIWHKKCRMCFDEDSLLKLLSDLVNELEHRKTLFQRAECRNIVEYNAASESPLNRYIFGCDEIAEILDKTGRSKEQKELVAQIESKLSIIARQGRAFGIHLILATQRPDAHLVPGQIRTNLGCRICGRADNILSQIILDSTAAAERIPKEAQGRFVLYDGSIFQAFWFNETNL